MKKLDHIHQWKHNRVLLGQIPPSHVDWIVTVAFYTALHITDALFANDGITVTSHNQRNDILFRTNRYKKINACFHPLYGLCRTVRYMANPSQWVSFDKIDKDVLESRLYPIEKSSLSLMNLSAEYPHVPVKLMQK